MSVSSINTPNIPTPFASSSDPLIYNEILNTANDKIFDIFLEKFNKIFSTSSKTEDRWGSISFNFATGTTYLFTSIKGVLEHENYEQFPESRKEAIQETKKEAGRLLDIINEVPTKDRVSLADRISLCLYNTLERLFSSTSRCHEIIMNKIESLKGKVYEENNSERLYHLLRFLGNAFFNDKTTGIACSDMSDSNQVNEDRGMALWQQPIGSIIYTLLTLQAGLEETIQGPDNRYSLIDFNSSSNREKWETAFPNCPVSWDQLGKLYHAYQEAIHPAENLLDMQDSSHDDPAITPGETSDIATPQATAEASSSSIEENLMVKNGMVLPAIETAEVPAESDDTIILDADDHRNPQRPMPGGSASDNDIAPDHTSEGRPRSNTV